MRRVLLGVGIFVAALLALLAPTAVNAQVTQVQTPAPKVTAAAATWQLNDEPVLLGDDVYYATGDRVFFDGNVMKEIGRYAGVPLYADATELPNSLVYVPVAGSMLRRYERRRDGELAGTEGSRTPSFPVANSSESQPQDEAVAAAESGREAGRVEATAGSAAEVPVPTDRIVAVTTAVPRRQNVTISTGVELHGNGGVWIQYGNARWDALGDTTVYSPVLFRVIGEYHGFPVYRKTQVVGGDIFIASVKGGALARYRKAEAPR